MATAGSDRDLAPDNWFDEPETADPASDLRVDRIVRERSAHEIDDWIADTAGPAAAPLRRPSVGVIALAALAVCLLLGILAAAGVFSGGGHRAAPPPTHPATTTTAAAAQPPPTFPVPTGPLKPGDSGAAVKKLQRALLRAGFGPGAIDGKYGQGTTQAVMRFQQAHALTADGIAGTKTLAALTNALVTG
jgi:hypothetical protein